MVFLVVLVGGTIALLYRYGPSRDRNPGQRIFAGAILATLLWLIASAGLSFYVSHIAQFGVTYGPLGAVVAIMLWFYLTAYAVLLGAELNAQLEHRTRRGRISRLANETAACYLTDHTRTFEQGTPRMAQWDDGYVTDVAYTSQLLPRDHAELARLDEPAARPSPAGPRGAVQLRRPGLRQRLHHACRRRNAARTRRSGGSTSIRRMSSSPTASPHAPA